MQYTDNYSLKKPQRGVDRANVDDLDDNFEIIDRALADDRQISLLMYDSTSTYNTGDIVGYENPTTHRIRAYRCLEDNVTGPWDATKWAQTTLADEIGTGGGASSLADLTDTDITSPTNGQTLKYNSTSGKWENASGGAVSDLDDLGDVDITTPSDGDLLTYDAQNDEWVNAPASVPDLGDLGDVTFTTPSDGQTLTYDDGEWVNKDLPAVTKTASGNPIEVSDSANAPLVKCVTEIQGSQDLHGYDKPWVGGAGKNKLDLVSITPSKQEQGITFTVNSDGTISANGTATGQCQIVFNIPQSTAQTFANLLFTRGSNVPVGLTYAFELGGSPYTQYLMSDGTISSSIASASTSVNFIIRMQAGTTLTNVLFEPMLRESGTTADFEPYSNICPITAYTEGEIEVRGKNILKNATAVRTEYSLYIGQDNTTDYPYLLKANKSYTLSTDATSSFAYYIKEGDAISIYIGGMGGTVTPTEDIKVKFYLYANSSMPTPTWFQLEEGSTATPYEPYTSTHHTTTFPSAIYRGSEDCVNETETHDMIAVDLGDLTWNYNSALKTFYTPLGDIPKRYTALEIANALSEKFGVMSNSDITDDLTLDGVFSIHYEAQQSWLNVRWLEYTVASAFKTAVTGTRLAYELATPTTSSVTPTNLPVKSLNGYSHIESSTGDMEIEYITSKYSPITEVVSRQISTVEKLLELIITANREEEMKATQNYTAGALLIVSGKLYKASSNIANGSTLVINSNVTSTTIAAELAALA